MIKPGYRKPKNLNKYAEKYRRNRIIDMWLRMLFIAGIIFVSILAYINFCKI